MRRKTKTKNALTLCSPPLSLSLSQLLPRRRPARRVQRLLPRCPVPHHRAGLRARGGQGPVHVDGAGARGIGERKRGSEGKEAGKRGGPLPRVVRLWARAGGGPGSGARPAPGSPTLLLPLARRWITAWAGRTGKQTGAHCGVGGPHAGGGNAFLCSPLSFAGWKKAGPPFFDRPAGRLGPPARPRNPHHLMGRVVALPSGAVAGANNPPRGGRRAGNCQPRPGLPPPAQDRRTARRAPPLARGHAAPLATPRPLPRRLNKHCGEAASLKKAPRSGKGGAGGNGVPPAWLPKADLGCHAGGSRLCLAAKYGTTWRCSPCCWRSTRQTRYRIIARFNRRRGITSKGVKYEQGITSTSTNV